MPRVESTVTINAPRDQIMSVARDVESYPKFMTDVESITVIERSEDGLRVVSDWVGVVAKIGKKIRWTQEDSWSLDEGISRFRQLKGDYDQFEGEWRFTALEPGVTRFDSVLDYRLEIPLVGGIIKAIVHKLIQSNLDSTLAAIKARCENGAG